MRCSVLVGRFSTPLGRPRCTPVIPPPPPRCLPALLRSLEARLELPLRVLRRCEAWLDAGAAVLAQPAACTLVRDQPSVAADGNAPPEAETLGVHIVLAARGAALSAAHAALQVGVPPLCSDEPPSSCVRACQKHHVRYPCARA